MANVDRNQMRQLFLNLVENSIDSLRDGGRIEIEIGKLSYNTEHPFSSEPSEELDRERKQITYWIVIYFRDSGTGIDPKIVGTLFEPFVTTKETGTGLGLSICQQIASARGGILQASNREGQPGAELKLVIPLNTK